MKNTRKTAEKEIQTEAAHTPGPWGLENMDGEYFPSVLLGPRLTYHDKSGTYQARVIVSEGPSAKEVASGFCGLGTTMERCQANARLIAAAPDLLEALILARRCIAYCRKAHKNIQSGDGIPVEEWIDAAIAKATVTR